MILEFNRSKNKANTIYWNFERLQVKLEFTENLLKDFQHNSYIIFTHIVTHIYLGTNPQY